MRAVRASASTAPLPLANRLTATLLLFCARAAHPAEAFATQQPKSILARALVAVQSTKVPRLVSPNTLTLRASPWVQLVRSSSTAAHRTRTAAILPPSTTAKHTAATMRKHNRIADDGGLKLGGVGGDGGGGGDSGDGGGGGSSSSSSASLTLPAFLEMSSARGKTQASGGDSGNVVFHVFSGNEACDADSICSAICMAFLKQSTAMGGGVGRGGGGGGGGGGNDDVVTKGSDDATAVLYVPGECRT